MNKESRLVEGSLYIPDFSFLGKVSVFLEPTLPVIALLLSKKRSFMLELRTTEI